jgi:hypothetical protein
MMKESFMTAALFHGLFMGGDLIFHAWIEATEAGQELVGLVATFFGWDTEGLHMHN